VQTVILCGGKGTRIRDVSEDLPKPMIPVGPRPILWHIMKLYAHHGHRDFVLCLGHKGWQIKRYFLDYYLADADVTVDLGRPGRHTIHGSDAGEDWRVTLVETGLETMTGGRVKRVEKYVEGDEFLLTYGDGVADVDLSALIAFHRAHGRLATVTAVKPPSRFGELDLDGDRVVSFMEKPATMGGFISGGFFVLNRDVFRHTGDDPALVFELGVLPELARQGQLAAYHHTGFWHAMDGSRDHQVLNDMWNAGQAPWAVWDPPPALRLAA
jgi:glucose-1-phosphate cytidylyltransferase